MLRSYLRLTAYAKRLEFRPSLVRKPWGQIARLELHQSEYFQSEAKSDLQQLLDDRLCSHPSLTHWSLRRIHSYSQRNFVLIPPTHTPLPRLRL
jgi:hypothetical protein